MLSCSQRSLQAVLMNRGILGPNLISVHFYQTKVLAGSFTRSLIHESSVLSPESWPISCAALWVGSSSVRIVQKTDGAVRIWISKQRRRKREQIKHIPIRVKWWFPPLWLLELNADLLVWFVADWPISIAAIGLIEDAWHDKGPRCCRATRVEIVAAPFFLSSPQSE